jgi:hypothetical protein
LSDRPLGPGWWLASDGRWYPPEALPVAPPAGMVPWAYVPDVRMSPGLHISVRIFLYITTACSALAILALANAIPKVGSAVSEWDGARSLSSAALGLTSLMSLVLVILLMIWGNQAYRSLGRSGAQGCTWSPGWAIGGWFIPIASVVIPRLVFSEIERLAHPGNGPAPILDRWRRQPLLGIGLAWWALLVTAGVLGGIGAFLEGWAASSDLYYGATYIVDEGMYRNGMVVLAVALGLAGVGQVIGAAYFRELGERLLK